MFINRRIFHFNWKKKMLKWNQNLKCVNTFCETLDETKMINLCSWFTIHRAVLIVLCYLVLFISFVRFAADWHNRLTLIKLSTYVKWKSKTNWNVSQLTTSILKYTVNVACIADPIYWKFKIEQKRFDFGKHIIVFG